MNAIPDDALEAAFDGARHAARRLRVLEALGTDAAMLLPAAPEILVGRDEHLRYRIDPELHYLTGYPEPEAAALLDPSDDEAPFRLFVRPRDPDAELWTGARGGPEAAVETFGADAAHTLDELPEVLGRTLERVDTLHYRLRHGRHDVDALVLAALALARRSRQRRGRGARAVVDPAAILDELRLVKDQAELELIGAACRLTVEGVREAAGSIRPGAGEWEVEAALEAAFRRRGAQGSAFVPIVAAGANATVLHYTANRARMAAGELLLIDAGARRSMYNGDLSRTFPVSGRFTAPQRALYRVVLSAHDRALAAVRPGASEEAVHDAAVGALVEGLVAEGLLEGDPAELAADPGSYRHLFPHRASHWLGLEVHDVGDYARAGEPRPLEPGMVLTVEPGLYIPLDFEPAPAELRGVGIRIEDDVVVTDTGHEVLTAGLPTDPEEVEALIGS